MDGETFASSTVLFPDVMRQELRTELDEEMLIRRLPRPTSAVPCAIPVTLQMLHARSRALVHQLDVSGALLHVEYALPDDAMAWLRLPLPGGNGMLPGRVVQLHRRDAAMPWEVELKFHVSDTRTRAGLAGLIGVLRRLGRRR
ncbi:MAG: PilZ domain-containing protein [Myxococcales bacterium]|nr:PilZ domain-containing protein [Myxococcales bacterium]